MTDAETKLLKFQALLEKHFRELRSSRSSDQPIFALEHCLDEREVGELFHAVREHVRAKSPSTKHSLPWIVYSSELGYGFSGYEYWQTFEEKTPGWPGNEYRYWLRCRYQSFAADYGGAEPSGAWAEHFSIICWPITHAILPKDLQLHLARILWEARNSFSEETLESPQTLGELIHSRSWNASSHFRYFAKNKQLVGQVAAPLLFEGRSGTDKFIHPETLARIRKDLNNERKAREWLKAAQGEVRRRVSVKGVISSWKDPAARDIDSPQKARKEIEKLGIEPRLLLRPEDRENRQWTVRLEIPDLSHLPNRFPDILELLAESRCVVEGAGRRPLARGMFLHGAHSVRLEKWPGAREILLKFERENRKFNYLLQTECLLRPASKRLFRIASDGLAYETRNLRVRPGEHYVLLSTKDPIEVKNNACALTEILCEGVHGAVLKLPDAISSDLEKFLQEQPLSSGEIKQAVREMTLNLKAVPVLCGSAFKNKGVQMVLSAVLDYLPSPLDIPPVEGKTKTGQIQKRKTQFSEKTAALAFKIVVDPYAGTMTYIRLYSGEIQTGQTLINARENKKERIGKIVKVHAGSKQDVLNLKAGDIGAILGLKWTRTGDTLCEKDPFFLESIQFPEPVISIAVEAESLAERKKMESAFEELKKEDPSFSVRSNQETGQTLMEGMGELHLEVLIHRLKNQFKLKIREGKPQVFFKETLLKKSQAESIFEKEIAGKKQYAKVQLEIFPLERGEGFQFHNKIREDSFIPAIKEGVMESASVGAEAGYPLTDVGVNLLKAEHKEGEPSELAFKVCASQVFHRAAQLAGGQILEPIFKLEIITPEEFIGDVVSDLNSRRGSIEEIQSKAHAQVISAKAPLLNLLGYATHLRSLTQGRASFSMELEGYDILPEKHRSSVN